MFPYKALTERRYMFLSRSGFVQRAPLQTQLVFAFLSTACTSRRFTAGVGCPLPYNARLAALHPLIRLHIAELARRAAGILAERIGEGR